MSICRYNKMCFATKADAQKWLKESQSRQKGQHKMRPYECHVCGQWHFTTQKKTEERRIARRSGRR